MKTILHLCADLGSDSRYYQLCPEYDVIMIGEKIGVENYSPDRPIHGIIANPVSTEFSTARSSGGSGDLEKGMFLVNHCLRIIKESNPKWWVLENPAAGDLDKKLGKPLAKYQPWQYGSPWTKHTALWGDFIMPEPLFKRWEDCPKNPSLYVRPGRPKPSLAFLHKSAVALIPEMQWAKDHIKTDADFMRKTNERKIPKSHNGSPKTRSAGTQGRHNGCPGMEVCPLW